MDSYRLLKYIALFLFDFFSVTVMINAPNLLVGYGLIVSAMMISLLFTDPVIGGLIFLSAHIAGSIILILSRSTFLIVAVLSMIIRPLILLLIAKYFRDGVIRSIAFLLTLIVILDSLISYTIALAYYARDAIEVGLNIYSAIYIPYVYLAYRHYTRNNIGYSIISISAMILYYFSASYFLAYPLNILSIATLLFLIGDRPREQWRYTFTGFIIGVILLTPVSMPSIGYNIQITLYPYNPSTWLGEQWIQRDVGEHCRPGDVLADVYSPERLRIIDTCITVTGVVVTEPNIMPDGDIVFDVKLDEEYSHIISIGSWILRRGAIHVEIVPADRGIVEAPRKGDRVILTGVLVIDTDHGSWSEIHPVWWIEVVEE